MNVRSSYTAASAAPVKLYRDLNLLQSISVGKILPRHVQIAITNRCNENCPWCSCSERDKRQELTEKQLMSLLDDFEMLGTRAITVTGGGEPTLHPAICTFLTEANAAGMKTGLVTNGVPAIRLTGPAIRTLSWCRVSFSDTRDWSRPFEYGLEHLQSEGCRGLAFSYVLTNEVNERNLVQTVRHAVEHDYTHVRVVDDILHPSPVSMERSRVVLHESGLPLDRVIFQPRSEYEVGRKRCWASLLKPFIAPDGYIYPCCGVAYAIRGQLAMFPPQMRMGGMGDLKRIIDDQRVFDGAACYRCFYGPMIEALQSLLTPLDHVEFL